MKHKLTEQLFASQLRAMVRRILWSVGPTEEKVRTLRDLARRSHRKALRYSRLSRREMATKSPRGAFYRNLAKLRLRASRFLEACARQVQYERKKACNPGEYPFMDYSA
ncbi:MAG: hypothetical protein WHU10_06025 [Fimbriimonadales bacterium]